MNTGPDLNLLRALNALLTEVSVAAAARKLGLSASAMSRTLARLRDTIGDPLLVRAGRGMVLTPHAKALRDRVPLIADEVENILGHSDRPLDLANLHRLFTIRANDAFVVSYASTLVNTIAAVAPHVRLRFAPKTDKAVHPLREGLIDLEIGVVGETGPGIKVQALFQDHFVGAARLGHPLVQGDITARRFADCDHVIASRRAKADGPVDRALAALGLNRRSVLLVPSFPTALAVAFTSDLVTVVTYAFAHAQRGRSLAGLGPSIHYFDLPLDIDPVTISQIWHPRMDNDPAHRWLRSLIKSCCKPQRDQGQGGFPPISHPDP